MHNTSNGPITFGPAFHSKFLLSVLHLQQSIREIGKGKDYGLDKICFAPLRSPGQVTLKNEECVVQSIWGYYQDSEDTFNATETDANGYEVNYLDKFLACTQ